MPMRTVLVLWLFLSPIVARVEDVDLSTLTIAKGFKIVGAVGNDANGYSVSDAGDVNGDGHPDVLIGARFAGAFNGICYVIFGQLSVNLLADIDLATMVTGPTTGFRITGDANVKAGTSVSTAGDINGDGVSDIIIGGPQGSPTGSNTQAGITYVVFGRVVTIAANNAFSDVDLATMTTSMTSGFKIFGKATNDASGIYVSDGGDISGDGKADVIIGATTTNRNSKNFCGTVYVIFGRTVTAGNAFSNIELSAIEAGSGDGFAVFGATASDQFGISVSSAGDFNGDGASDLIASSTFAKPVSTITNGGIVWILFNRNGNINLASWTTGITTGFRILSGSSNTFLGGSVSNAGDINADGRADIIIGTGNRLAFVIFGRLVTSVANAFGDIDLALWATGPTIGFRIVGVNGVDGNNLAVSRAGDVNGDGIADLVIGAKNGNAPGKSGAGITYVIFGRWVTSAGTAFSDISLASVVPGSSLGFRIFGAAASDQSGFSVSAAGDVNNDGIGDIVVGAPSVGLLNPTRANIGTSYVIFGSTFEPTSQPSSQPSQQPVLRPTSRPSGQPSTQPSGHPSSQPSRQPSAQPFSKPSSRPSQQPVSRPSSQPSVQPSSHPSSQPSVQPSRKPSSQPTQQPTQQPSVQPSRRPSSQPTIQPSRQPSVQPSSHPSGQPSVQPSRRPSAQPTRDPTRQPSTQPSARPSKQPTIQPTRQPSMQPSARPTRQPSTQPSAQPSSQPSKQPSRQPTQQPSAHPSSQPTSQPTQQPSTQPSVRPSGQPSVEPSRQPTGQPSTQPSRQPTQQPSAQPSSQPTMQPTRHPSAQPSARPTGQPSAQPSAQPSNQPSHQPSRQPTSQPSCQPSAQPSQQPSRQPSSQPSVLPSSQPSGQPSRQPTAQPTIQPSEQPSCQPVCQPTSQPSQSPTAQPSTQPSAQPSGKPTRQPSRQPTSQPSEQPSGLPSRQPTQQPTTRPSRQPSTTPSTPSGQPSVRPSVQPTHQPTEQPSSRPSSVPTTQPSAQPSRSPTGQPSVTPSTQPTTQPSNAPSAQPIAFPTVQPSTVPSSQPSKQPLSAPTVIPTAQPSVQPSAQPSCQPLVLPSAQPSQQPSSLPSCQPTSTPSTQPLSAPSGRPSVQPSAGPSNQPSEQPTSLPSGQPRAVPTGRPSAQPSASPTYDPRGEWVTTIPTIQQVQSLKLIGTDTWTCGSGGSSDAGVGGSCALLEVDRGAIVKSYVFPWKSVTSVEPLWVGSVFVTGATAGTELNIRSDYARCQVNDDITSCSATSITNMNFQDVSFASFPELVVIVGAYTNLACIGIVNAKTNTIAFRKYTQPVVASVSLTHVKSTPNYVGSFVAGTCVSSTGAATIILVGVVRTDTGSLTGTGIVPMRGNILNSAELVNAMALEYLGPDSFIAGGLELSDGAGMHAYIVRANALYQSVIYGIRYRIRSSGFARRLYTSSMYSSSARSITLQNNVLYVLTQASNSSFTVLKVDMGSGLILQQVHVIAPNETVSCTKITTSAGLFVNIACHVGTIRAAPQTMVLSTDLILSFSYLPEGYTRDENVVFYAEKVAFQRTRLPFAMQTILPTVSTYEFTVTNQAPTRRPSVAPSILPSVKPTLTPTVPATAAASALSPFTYVESNSTLAPTTIPSCQPTLNPTSALTTRPSLRPTIAPSTGPSVPPSALYTSQPTHAPTRKPQKMPTLRPTTSSPSFRPTVQISDTYSPDGTSDRHENSDVEVTEGTAVALVGLVLFAYACYRLRIFVLRQQDLEQQKAREERLALQNKTVGSSNIITLYPVGGANGVFVSASSTVLDTVSSTANSVEQSEHIVNSLLAKESSDMYKSEDSASSKYHTESSSVISYATDSTRCAEETQSTIDSSGSLNSTTYSKGAGDVDGSTASGSDFCQSEEEEEREDDGDDVEEDEEEGEGESEGKENESEEGYEEDEEGSQHGSEGDSTGTHTNSISNNSTGGMNVNSGCESVHSSHGSRGSLEPDCDARSEDSYSV